MQPKSPSQEDADLYRASADAILIHGEGSLGMTPLEIIIAEEEKDKDNKQKAASEILLRLLTFAADGMRVRGIKAKWKQISVKIPACGRVYYCRESTADEIPWPYVEILDEAGNTVKRYEPARLKSIRNPRGNRGEKSKYAVINELAPVDESAATRVGSRIISLATLAGVNSIRELTGAKIADKLGVTRQAVSLTNKAMEAKIKLATGGKSTARGIRAKPDPRKGTKKTK